MRIFVTITLGAVNIIFNPVIRAHSLSKIKLIYDNETLLLNRKLNRGVDNFTTRKMYLFSIKSLYHIISFGGSHLIIYAKYMWA